ncbi:MAG: Do family serine endopeptidase [Candidatus Omnitrophica bacterium]|nr:Do family serine endopeptidase [Candidatus Omnitrophota bacterium]MCM8794051.1 Do family serine endopeptidase [Candidatus Omnitrophota bacterium]
MEVNLNKKTGIGLLIMGLIVGVVCGMVITTRFNFNPPTQAISTEEINNLALTLENAFVKVAEEVGPAVVSISTETTEVVGGREFFFSPFGDDFFDEFFKEFFGEIPRRKFKRMGIGSGVIVHKDGYILTNQHVIESAQKIVVTLPDGREFKGEVKGVDTRGDLAVIKINAHNLPVAKLGNSDEVKIGQWSIAIGNPFGFAINNPKPTLTVGVISALNRTLPRTSRRDRLYTGLIQTDAAINPGNSGGPLVNIKGEVIGINVAIFTTSGGYQGVGFAIPINTAKAVLQNLIEGKKVAYGWLGINIQDIDEKIMDYFGLSDKEGVIVAEVLADTPAEKAGLKEGDIIKTYEGEKVKDTNDLMLKVGYTPVGKKVKLGIIRDKRELDIEVVVGERPEEVTLAKEKTAPVWRGMVVENLTPEEAKKRGLDKSHGVIIVKIEENSPAEEAGLSEGDVIVSINNIPIKNLEDYQKLTSSIKGDCLLRTQRGFVVLKEKVE